MEKLENHDLISALADGQLQGEAFARGVAAVASDPAARETWQTYHLIGDVLRSGELAQVTPPAVFLSRLTDRLAQEGLTAVPVPATDAASLTPKPGVNVSEPAANDASFRWKLVAGFASLAAMGAIGWNVVGSLGPQPQAQLAAAPAPVGGERGVMIRDARLDELLAAHRQFGGAAALEMPAGYLRNATLETPAR